MVIKGVCLSVSLARLDGLSEPMERDVEFVAGRTARAECFLEATSLASCSLVGMGEIACRRDLHY